MTIEDIKTQIGDREIIFKTGHLAKQAHGSLTVQCGDTVIFAAVVSAPEPREGIDFFPLMVDYRERTYAAGRIPGGYFKREGRPTEKEILTSRLIDRPIRPLFPGTYFCETQVSVVVLSSDGENATDVLAMNAASAALLISDSPFNSPIGAVRVGLIEGNLVCNPPIADMAKSDLDLILAATEEKVLMIEAGAKELTEEKMTEAIWFAHAEAKKSIAAQRALQEKVGKPKRETPPSPISQEILDKVDQAIEGEFEKLIEISSKEERAAAKKAIYTDKVLAQFDVESPDFKESQVKMLFDECEKKKVREFILDQGKRPDGRGARDMREITCEVGVLPRTHGSAVFTRGQTQSLCVTTLGTGDDEQRVDTLEGEEWKSFLLHYNFPSYSVGEARPNRGPGRREIGHGALAYRALCAVLPEAEKFPYTIRLVSEIMESNGSSSMASVCGGTLALLDAGVPLKAPVAGIAIGLVTSPSLDSWQVLTDIAGIEDHHGDMDFKAAGTSEGLTALQMDLKISGITNEILQDAFDHAKTARMTLLGNIADTIAQPKEMSTYAPRIVSITINPEKIGELIGPGGKNIRKITEETGAKIDIEDDGTVKIASLEAASGDEALARVKAITEEPEIGRVYEGTVKKLMTFGAFCEILPGKEALCHVSEVTDGFVKNVADYLRIGDVVPVKVMEVDARGKVSLSIKAAKEGGMPILPPDVERDEVTEMSKDRGGGRGGGRPRR